MERGHTLLELSAVLALMALAGSALVPAGRGLRDRSAVVSAREEVAGLFAEARVAAVALGGATVHVDASAAHAWYVSGGVTRRNLDLMTELGVDVILTRGRSQADVAFDALGLGRVASETLRFRRGDAEATLVVSSYGRVRRW